MVVKSKKKLPCEIRVDMILIGICPDCGIKVSDITTLWYPSGACKKCNYVYYIFNNNVEW